MNHRVCTSLVISSTAQMGKDGAFTYKATNCTCIGTSTAQRQKYSTVEEGQLWSKDAPRICYEGCEASWSGLCLANPFFIQTAHPPTSSEQGWGRGCGSIWRGWRLWPRTVAGDRSSPTNKVTLTHQPLHLHSSLRQDQIVYVNFRISRGVPYVPELRYVRSSNHPCCPGRGSGFGRLLVGSGIYHAGSRAFFQTRNKTW